MRQFDENIENQQELFGEEQDSRSLQEYLLIAKKYWLIIVIVFGVGVVGSIFYTLRQPKVYQATASIVIDPQPPQVFGSQVQEIITLGTGSFWSNQEYYNTQVEVLKSFDLAKITIEHNDLSNEKSLLLSGGENLEKNEKVLQATGTFAGGLSVTHKGDSRIVTMSVKLEDPELAVRLANLHVETFLEYTRGLRTGGTGKISKYLSTELDRSEKRLQASEDAILDFKRENNLLSTSLEDAQSILAKELSRYTNALGNVRIKRVEEESSLRRAKSLLKEKVLESPIFTLATSTGVEELKTQYAKESRKLRELEEQYGPKHPQVQGQKKQVAAITSDLHREARRTVRELEERYHATLSVEREHKKELSRLKTEAANLEPMTNVYNRLKRQERADSEAHENLRKRLNVSNMTGRNQAINIRPHVEARVAGKVSPRMSVNVGLAALLSLLLGLSIAMLLEALDRTIKSADQVEALLHAPVLGVIPVVTGGNHDRKNPTETKNRDLHVHENPASRVAECCRAIRTNILFASTEKRMKIVTISSPRPKEGKSTTTIYLGTTMAQSGQRVLIVDTDLRRPRLHKAFDVSRDNGLSTLILGETSMDEAIKSTQVPGLFIMSAGPQPPNPAELLLTESFGNILKKLEEQFDLVLLDSPPLLAVSDPVVLSRLSDGVLLVLQAGNTSIDDALSSVRSLRAIQAPILGVVLNDIDIENRNYGYGSKYYGYGGYSEEYLAEA